MTKNELMEMVEDKALCISAGYIEIGIDELAEFANAILERAAVECHQGVARMSSDIDGVAFYIATGQCANAIRALKIGNQAQKGQA